MDRGLGTRERIVTEALALFAENGFRGTRIVEIEAAAGLSPGSGALYSHFRTKEDVLVAAVERSMSLVHTGAEIFDLLPLGDLRAELQLLTRASLRIMDSYRDLIRVLLKEAEQFPVLVHSAREQVLDRSYRWFAEWLTMKQKSGEVVACDAEVETAIWLGAITHYWIMSSLLAEAPLALEEDRFVTNLVDSMVRSIGPRDRPGTSEMGRR